MSKTISVVILEDEHLAAENLQQMLIACNANIEIMGVFDSVKSSLQWFLKNNPPDLIFSDIQLSDGLSFEIFETININVPIIFTTAYNDYAIRAFKHNSIDYLLKPYDKKEIQFALNKFLKQQEQTKISISPEFWNQLSSAIEQRYRNRFLIKIGEKIKFIETKNILYFYSLEKATFCKTTENADVLLDFSLDQIEQMVTPDNFFRINRKYIVTLSAIKEIIAFTNSRLKIDLQFCDDKEVIVSRERVNLFKSWIDR